MNNIKKIGLTALAGSLVASSVSAATLTATGSAGMSYTGGDEKATQGQGWTMGDSITMSASGDVTLSPRARGTQPEREPRGT